VKTADFRRSAAGHGRLQPLPGGAGSVTFGQQPGFPALRIVDSTDPEQVWTARNEVNLADTLVVVASKSGSTLEPNVLKQYFFDEMKKAVGAEQVGSHFVAITDPGSKMEQVAKDDGFRYIFYGDPQIGGRFSALSNFGVVAATLAGLNTRSCWPRRPRRGRGQAGPARIPPSNWACCWARRPTPDATSSPSSPRRRSTTWAHGWSS
jgi:transaldolase/glucose-6-phosphate isomerase